MQPANDPLSPAECRLQLGELLESEHLLAKKFCVSRPTIRHAFGNLHNRGMVTVRRGRNRLVSSKIAGTS